MSESSAAERPPDITYHLTPTEVWEARAGADAYRPEAFDADGFIHCTNGEANLLAVANAFYQGDRRSHVVLSIAVGRVSAPIRYEDPERLYPHIYGPLNRDAVVAVRRVSRLADGSFATIAG